MGRENTHSMRAIHLLCRMHHLEEKEIYDKARLLLSVYRRVCWKALERSYDVAREVTDFSLTTSLDSALIFLETFAPEEERVRFESDVVSLFETRYFMELIHRSMECVRDYPERGEEYYAILSKCYLERRRCSEAELLNFLHMERSRFYDRKKEAVMFFAIALFGTVLPMMRQSGSLVRQSSEQSPTSVLL